MRFPNQPPGMDFAFYRQLEAWGREVVRVAKEESRTVQLPSVPASNPYPNTEPFALSTGSAQTFTIGDMNAWWHINATGNFNLTLPAPIEGTWVGLYNYGANTVTVKNPGGTTIGTLAQYEGAMVLSLPDSSGVPAWPTALTDLPGSFSLSAEPVLT